jgi:hypothetical protein
VGKWYSLTHPLLPSTNSVSRWLTHAHSSSPEHPLTTSLILEITYPLFHFGRCAKLCQFDNQLSVKQRIKSAQKIYGSLNSAAKNTDQLHSHAQTHWSPEGCQTVLHVHSIGVPPCLSCFNGLVKCHCLILDVLQVRSHGPMEGNMSAEELSWSSTCGFV